MTISLLQELALDNNLDPPKLEFCIRDNDLFEGFSGISHCCRVYFDGRIFETDKSFESKMEAEAAIVEFVLFYWNIASEKAIQLGKRRRTNDSIPEETHSVFLASDTCENIDCMSILNDNVQAFGRNLVSKSFQNDNRFGYELSVDDIHVTRTSLISGDDAMQRAARDVLLRSGYPIYPNTNTHVEAVKKLNDKGLHAIFQFSKMDNYFQCRVSVLDEHENSIQTFQSKHISECMCKESVCRQILSFIDEGLI
jgi:hypothetical protein